jgi:bacillithiol synthase
MEIACVRHDVIPGTSALFADYLYHFERVDRFFAYPPFEDRSFDAAAARIQYPEERRRQVVEALSAINLRSEGLERLAKPNTVAVVTGQQVGLFGGPVYTLYKALTAVHVARQLTARGIDAVPVFWAATEDHDLEEVAYAWVFNQAGKPTKLEVHAANASRPVGRIPLPELPFSELRQGLEGLPFAADVVALVERCYRPGAAFGDCFLELFRQIMDGLGVVVVDPLLSPLRRVMAPFLVEAMKRLPAMRASLFERDRELAEAGYHSQVNLEADSSLLFLLDNGRRLALRLRNGNFATKEREYTLDQLSARGEDLSPNALLRPVMQDYLLPTVADVGGPAEVAYLAQSRVIYDQMLGRMPVLVPRQSWTLLDRHVAELAKRYGLELTDLFDPRDRVRERIAARLVPAGLTEQFCGARTAAQSMLEGLRSKLTAFDPTLEASARKSQAKILYQLEKLERKTARERLRRDKRAQQEADTLIDTVYPHRHLQERLYSMLPFLAKFGMDLPQRLLHLSEQACPDHLVRVLD